MKKRTLNNDTLDLLEDRLLRGMLGELDDDLPAATMEILRRVLHDNGRLTRSITPGDPGDILSDASEDELNGGTTIPFPTAKRG